MELPSIISGAVYVYVAYAAVTALRDRTLTGPAMGAVRSIRARTVATNLVVIVAVIAAHVALSTVPALRFGWPQLLGGSTGNVALTGTTTNRVGLLALLGVVAGAVPAFAYAEETMFRRGAQTRSRAQRWRANVTFGLAHMIVGVSVATGLALSIAGWWFTHHYLAQHHATLAKTAAAKTAAAKTTASHGTQRDSTRPDPERDALRVAAGYHIAWNWTLLAVVVASVART